MQTHKKNLNQPSSNVFMNVHSADKNIHRRVYRSSLVMRRSELAEIVPQIVKAIVKYPWSYVYITQQQYILMYVQKKPGQTSSICTGWQPATQFSRIFTLSKSNY